MTNPVPPPASETILGMRRAGYNQQRWQLTLSCGHRIYWDGQKPKIRAVFRCPEPECHPITIVKGVPSNE